MPIQTTIYSLSGTSPFDVYICQFNLTGCFYIDTITSGDIPFTFTIPAPYDTAESYCVKVVDDQGCVISGCSVVNPTPTPTNTVTPTNTRTPVVTPTNTPTHSVTPSVGVSQTPTNTPTLTPESTPTETPTNTPTPSITSSPGSSSTPTETPTNTPTYTPTETVTNTPTFTSTETPTATPTFTPTNTMTMTQTPTPTATLDPYPYTLAGYCYDGRMLADSGSAGTNCFQVQSGLGSSTRYKSNYPYSYLFNGLWSTVNMFIYDTATSSLLNSKPLSDGCQYWETSSLGKVLAGYPQVGFDCTGAGGCCPGSPPS